MEFVRGRVAPQTEEEIQQKRQEREPLLSLRVVCEHRREALAVRRKIVVERSPGTQHCDHNDGLRKFDPAKFI